ncbi:MAG: hypothetical protein U5N26_07220 [Candidatus Marinimicrobia bacterium]|nr:hypothetical protein [Candidatus Neomarinimicrobiota bacterium]
MLAQRWHRYNKDTGHMNQNHNVNAMKIMLRIKQVDNERSL